MMELRQENLLLVAIVLAEFIRHQIHGLIVFVRDNRRRPMRRYRTGIQEIFERFVPQKWNDI